MSNQAALNKRYEFVYLFDVKDGNPNGDPDAGNLPRIDPETGHGLVTDVCLKRKVRNYIEIAAPAREDNEGLQIFIREGAVLNSLIEDAYDVVNMNADKKTDGKDKARAEMCRRYYDVRTFGAVMSTGKKNAGQVRGPIQLTFSRSIDPIVPSEHTITRMAVTNERDKEKEQTMGRKATVPYGLYRCHGFVSAHLAADTGFTEADLELFWESLKNMFDHDHSASRGMMSPRALVVFKHSTALGNAPAHKLLERVKVSRKDGVTVPRSFDDYEISIDESNVPEGIEIIKMI
ncbi:MAG: type I-C CRISPR-associated protein Cas7/Csd2 [Porphyromonas sp.]|nr:type I-C CRISPR-associated protein Cas7/Csd2 [Bacteroidales bacterium]MDD7558890.1 type I-C CRISPR-associated protein Cas7/Csd2 [Bacteroidales bacterium]MDY3101376.1 type I-C CRISPR-associated protein Cas7/Csd2 [Porphyromonas sp.]